MQLGAKKSCNVMHLHLCKGRGTFHPLFAIRRKKVAAWCIFYANRCNIAAAWRISIFAHLCIFAHIRHLSAPQKIFTQFHSHMGITYFVEGGKIFFVCTLVKNAYRGGDVFGCHSLGEVGVRVRGGILRIKESNYLLLKKTIFLLFALSCKF